MTRQSDNYWLNTRTPALTYGLRGIAYFAINLSGPGQDLHSGLFGRMVHEPMTDLIKLMSKLVDHNGHILIPGIEAMVPPPDENEMYVIRCLLFAFRKTHGVLDMFMNSYFQQIVHQDGLFCRGRRRGSWRTGMIFLPSARGSCLWMLRSHCQITKRL